MPIKTIVAALALDVDDDPVVARVLQLARQHDARLIGVHALEDLQSNEDGLPPFLDREVVGNILKQDASDRLGRLFETASVPVEIVVQPGAPHALIDEVANHHKADLVVIGPGKPRNMRERVFGSTADRVVRSSHRPVLVVKARSSDPYQRTVAAVDFSATSIAAAQAVARISPTAMLQVLHAVEIPLSFEQAMRSAGTPPAEFDRYRRARAQSARKQLLALLSNEGGLPKGTRTRVLHGAAGDVLVRMARRGGTDLVALGTQGRSAVSRLLLGSVARKVLTFASCDVLVVPVGAAEGESA